MVVSLLIILANTSTGCCQVAPLPPWNVLAEESLAVIVGEVVEGDLWVIDRDKAVKASKTPDGKPTFPNPEEFLIGILSRVRITEAIKGGGKIKRGDTINVFDYGGYGFHLPHVLSKNDKCVLFLRQLDAKREEFADASILLPGTSAYPSKQPKFDPKGCYTPVREGYAQVILTPKEAKILDEIRRAVGKHP